jgi:hypothetical protein
MPTTPVVLQSKPGIQRDGTSFDSDVYNDGVHVRFDRGRPRKMWGCRTLVNNLSEISRGMHQFTRAGAVYIHTGGATKLESVTFDYNGYGGSVVDRTPSVFTASAQNEWSFDVIFDPVVNNNAMIVAHAAPDLTFIDNNLERPIYWGTIDGNTALTPLGLPVSTTATTITSITGTVANTSAVVSSVSATTALNFGYTVTGSGIPANTYIVSVGSGTFTMSQNATADHTDITITVTTGGVSGGVLALHPYLLAYSSNGSVQWTTPFAKGNTPADFWSTGSGAAYVTEQKIVAGKVLRGGPGYSPAGLLWSLNSLVRATFSGGSTVFSFDTISDTITILSPYCVVEVDGIYYWAGVDRFYAFGGTVRELVNKRNLSWFFDGMNHANKQKSFTFSVARWGEIWFCYPRGDATECSHAVIYNWRLDDWYDTELLDMGRSQGLSASVFPYPIMSGVDPDSVTGRYYLWQHEYGVDKVTASRTLPIKSFYETANFAVTTNSEKPEDRALRVVRVEPDIKQVGNMTMTVTGEANPKAPTVDSEQVIIYETPNNAFQQVAEVKTARRILRFRFESNTLGGDYYSGKTIGLIEPTDATYLGS